MVVDFEALVGYLYVVGGRAISAPPPGMLVEVAPKKASRGREMDTFFCLVLPSGEVSAPAKFYEQLAQTAAERYFSSSGSVTAGVRTVYTSINESLVEHNISGKRQYEAGLLCAVLHGDDLFVARAGSGVALLLIGREVQTFPTTFDNDEALFGPPLGVQPVPDIKMSRYRIISGSRVILADSSLAELSMDRMTEMLGRADISQVILGFRELVSTSLALVAVEVVPPEMLVPATLAVREGESTRVLTGGPAPAAATTETPVVENRKPDEAAGPGMTSVLQARAQRSAGRVALGLAGSLENINKKVERAAKPPDEERRGWLANPTTTAMTLLIPIAIVVLVILMWLGGTSESEFDLCFKEAIKAAQTVRSIASSDVNGLLAGWNAVLFSVERCNDIRPGDLQLAELMREGQTVIDGLYNIDRRETVAIEAFPNAVLTRVILRGEDLYVLDDNNDLVYRVTTTSDGLGITRGSRQAISTMRRGATVGQFTIGDLIDIAWAEEGFGLSQSNVLVSLDRNGVLVEYSPTFLARGVQRLLGTEIWVNPVRVTLWQGRLYILDPGANQIWRYDPSGGTYPSSPLEYFVGQGRPNIANAVDFGIDSNGRIFILFSDGVLSVYRSAELQPFGFSGFPESQKLTTVDAMYLDSNPTAQIIYLVSRNLRTIYETTLAGTFSKSYRAYDETQFASLASVVADESKRVIYALSGNSILAFRK